MKQLLVTVLSVIMLFSAATKSANMELSITNHQWQFAHEFFKKQGSEIENKLFSEYSPAKQALLLGSTLWLNNKSILLAQNLLLLSASKPETLNRVEQGYLFNLLAATYQAQNNIPQAVFYFDQSIAAKYQPACNNLGVMWEQQNNFKKAEQSYLACLSRSTELASPLLYLNLGTIYYNGAGQVAKNTHLGAQYWQKSYSLFPFDADIHYNLGTYHINQTKNYQQARYHFAYCALIDMQCSLVLANKKLVGLYGDKTYLDELLTLKLPYQREQLLSDRLKYAFRETIYFNEVTQNGLIFDFTQANEKQVSKVSVLFTQPQAELAINMLHRLVYIDMFSALNIKTLKLKQAIEQNKSIQFRYLNQTHYIKFKADNVIYSITFNDT